MTHTLTATPRDTKATAAALAAAGIIPAVVYGPKQESIAISLESRVFDKVLRDAGESSVIELSGVTSAPLQVLIHDLDMDPVKHIPRHVDFYAIEKGAKVEVAVQIEFVGESAAVKAGANLVKVLHELEVKADAAHLPHEITIDISVLENVGDQIHVRDIKLPTGVELVTDAEEVVAIAQAVEEEKEEAAPAVDMAAIEVEKKGKDEEEAAA